MQWGDWRFGALAIFFGIAYLANFLGTRYLAGKKPGRGGRWSDPNAKPVDYRVSIWWAGIASAGLLLVGAAIVLFSLIRG